MPIPLFAPFYNKEDLEDYITSLCFGEVKPGDLWILMGRYHQTMVNGWADDDLDYIVGCRCLGDMGKSASDKANGVQNDMEC